MSFYDWDTNPANNTSQPGIDWSEGQLPSSVNNSGRQMMADLAAFRASPQFTGTAQFENLTVSGTANIANLGSSLGATVTTGNGVVDGGNSTLELGGSRAGSGSAILDFHALASTDYEARIIRGPGANGGVELRNKGTGDFNLFQENAGNIQLVTNAIGRMIVTAAGLVGIGTGSPGSNLDVVGAVRTGTYQFSGSATTAVGADAARANFQTDTGDSYSYDKGNNLHEFYIANGRQAYVGIGGALVSEGYVKANSGVVYVGAAQIFYLNENGGTPLINFAVNQYLLFDPTSKNWTFVNDGGGQYSLGVSGLWGAGAAGGGKGTGTGNFSQLYENNVRVPTIVASSLGVNGYKHWSDGSWEMWGVATANANGATRVNFPGGITMSSFSNVVLSGGRAITNASDNDPFVSGTDTTGFDVFSASDVATTIWWQGKGV